MTTPTHVLCVDPGESTGWCSLRWNRGVYSIGAFGTARMTGAGHDWDPAERRLYDQVDKWLTEVTVDRGIDVLVLEDFVLYSAFTGRTPTADRVGLSAVRVSSCLLAVLHADEWSGQVVRQSSSVVNGKSRLVSDDQLRAAGLWILPKQGGTEHVRDAIRHAVIWGRKNEFEILGNHV